MVVHVCAFEFRGITDLTILIIIFLTGVECSETASGPRCGSCPSGYLGNGQQCQHICDARRPCGDRRCSPKSSGPYYDCEGCPRGFEWNGELTLRRAERQKCTLSYLL